MKLKKIKILLFLYLTGITSLISQTFESFEDTRDSIKYKTVVVGKQTWMAENLKFKIDNSWTYENKPENVNKFGRLYSWDAAAIACPSGWHLPSDTEWKELEKYLGMADIELDKNDKWRGTNQGALLISDTTLGFNMVMGGYRNPPSNYNLIDSQAFFWTSTLQYELPWTRQIYSKSSQIFRKTRPKSWAFSVRCIKD